MSQVSEKAGVATAPGASGGPLALSLEARIERLEATVGELLQVVGVTGTATSMEEHHARTVERVKLAKERGGLSA